MVIYSLIFLKYSENTYYNKLVSTLHILKHVFIVINFQGAVTIVCT